MFDLNLDFLKSFQVLVKDLNFSTAAKKLGYTQQALSYQMAQLEKKLQVRLFERLPQGVRLTGQGKRLLKELPSLFKTLESTCAHLQEFTRGGASQKMRLYFSESWTSDELNSEILLAFMQAYPELELEINQAPEEELKAHLLHHKDNLSLGCVPLDSEQLSSAHLLDLMAVVAAVPGEADSLLPGTDPGFIALTDALPFVSQNEAVAASGSLAYIMNEQLPQAKMHVDSVPFQLELAAQGRGRVLTHHLAVSQAQPLAILEQYPGLKCPLYLSWHKKRKHVVSAQELLDLLRPLCIQ